MTDFIVYLLVMALVTYAIRIIPLLIFKKPIENPFINSFLHYMPNTILAVMTVPAIFYCTGSQLASAIGFAFSLLLAYKGKDLLTVALGTSIMVLIVQLIETYLF